MSIEADTVIQARRPDIEVKDKELTGPHVADLYGCARRCKSGAKDNKEEQGKVVVEKY